MRNEQDIVVGSNGGLERKFETIEFIYQLINYH